MSRATIQMNLDNIQELFQVNGLDISNFLTRMNQSNSVCTGEALYLKLVDLLNLNKFEESNIQDACNSLNTNYNSKYIDFLVEKIIDDYNNFYLDDKYYHGYWHDESCYTDNTLTILVE